MSLRKVFLLALVACVVAAVVTVLVLRKDNGVTAEPPKAADTTAPAYAYTTEREFVLMRGESVVMKVARPFDRDLPNTHQVAWTVSGNYVALLAGAALLQEPPETEELITVDTRTGEQQRRRCPRCSELTAVGRDGVLAAIPGGHIRFDLDIPGDGAPVSLSAPPSKGYSRTFLASTEHLVLTQQTIQVGASAFSDRLELFRPDGANGRNLGFFESAMSAAAVGGPAESDSSFAVAVSHSPGLCFNASSVFLITADGKSRETNLSAAEPPGFVPNETGGGIAVHDLWWDTDRGLHASVSSWTCDESKPDEATKKVLRGPARLWRLDGSKWVQEDTTPTTFVRRLDQRSMVSLREKKLEIAEDGGRKAIAEGVISLYTAPVLSQTSKSARTVGLDSAPVPSLCEHPAGKLVEGSLPGIPEIDGYVALEDDPALAQDLTGDGKAEIVAVFGCSQGGVNWPESLVVYTPDIQVIGSVNLGDLVPAEHSEVDWLESRDGHVSVSWKSYEGAGQCEQRWTAVLEWNGSIRVRNLAKVGLAQNC